MGEMPPLLVASERELIVNPDPIPLGKLPPGRGARAAAKLFNPSSESLVVERVETSCPCVRSTTRLPLRINPGETEILDVEFDPSKEPGFRGGLGVDVVGTDAIGTGVFYCRVDVEVSERVETSD
ncbi:unnamed protein product [Phaeothamnion confervicola]